MPRRKIADGLGFCLWKPVVQILGQVQALSVFVDQDLSVRVQLDAGQRRSLPDQRGVVVDAFDLLVLVVDVIAEYLARLLVKPLALAHMQQRGKATDRHVLNRTVISKALTHYLEILTILV